MYESVLSQFVLALSVTSIVAIVVWGIIIVVSLIAEFETTDLTAVWFGVAAIPALICAISTNADYMFFDETFDGVDPVVRNFLKKVIADQMQKKETTIIMTSHNLRELEDFCDNLGLLHKGGILFESDIDSIKTNMFKVQISLKQEFSKEDFSNLEVLSFKKKGN